MSNVSPELLVVAHDAGGANILQAWVCKNAGDYRITLLTKGPASTIFENVEGCRRVKSFADLSGQIERVITGTSVPGGLELSAVEWAQENNIGSVAFLDHWCRYLDRFKWRDGYLFPDEVWVGDAYAYDLALELPIAKERVVQKENPYFESVRSFTTTKFPTPGRPLRLLYCFETLRESHVARFGALASRYDDEFDVLQALLRVVAPCADAITHFTFRLHPSEPPLKYENVLRDLGSDFSCSVSTNTSLLEDVADHDVIVGVETMALVIGLLMGKRAYSFRSGRAYSRVLPFTEIGDNHSFKTLLREHL